ncbi:hypothetical protein KCTCHS21_29070 [Cohnella abietis]|uniref:Uncharacterized protein n=1 Tax=Cohnella abietis TaxID=2507935 RepID=A0A3T1D608_9BACL|nr:hypothetical protein KCTCHS21_29070 [Cohnella abietis]
MVVMFGISSVKLHRLMVTFSLGLLLAEGSELLLDGLVLAPALLDEFVFPPHAARTEVNKRIAVDAVKKRFIFLSSPLYGYG